MPRLAAGPMEGDGISFACGDDVFAILCTKCTQSALKLLGDWSQTIYGAAPRAHEDPVSLVGVLARIDLKMLSTTPAAPGGHL